MSSFVPQGYHSHVKSKLLSVHVCSTQPERRDNTIPVNHRYLLRSNEKTIPVNNGFLDLIVKKPLPSNPTLFFHEETIKRSSNSTPFFSCRVKRILNCKFNSAGSNDKKQLS